MKPKRDPYIEAALSDPDNRFMAWRQLDDGTYIALTCLITTIGLCIDVDRTGYAQRYCFKDPTTAFGEYMDLKTRDDVPSGWVARRPELPEDIEAKAKPNYDPSQFWPKEKDDDAIQ